jgi:hypothetical protein
MGKFLAVLMIVIYPSIVSAQQPKIDTVLVKELVPLFKQYPVVPQFSLLNTDSIFVTKASLKNGVKTLIMVFNPAFGHCVTQTEEIIANIKKLKKLQIVMITFAEWSVMKKFETDFNLKQYKNITLLKDPNRFMGDFYKVRNIPFLALYNKKGSLTTYYEGGATIEKLLTDMK